MRKVFKKALFISLIIILSIFSINSLEQQPISDYEYNSTNNSKTFQITEAKTFQKDYIPSSISVLGGYFLNYNITQGETLKFQIAYSSKGLMILETLYLPNKGKFNSLIPLSPYLQPSFNNQSSAENYYKQSKIVINASIRVDGNYIILQNKTLLLNLLTVSLFRYNFKSGWLESQKIITTFPNGTIYYE